MEGRQFFERSPDDEISVGSIAGVYERWVNNPISRDPRTVTVSEAILGTLKSDGEAGDSLREAVQNMIDTHQITGDGQRTERQMGKASFAVNLLGARPTHMPYPEYAANLLLRGFWHQWRGMNIGWPVRFDKTAFCRQAIAEVIKDPLQKSELEVNLAFRPVQSTVPSRAYGPKLIMQANRHRFEHPISLLSVGHSLGLVEKKLLLDEPLEPVPAVEWHMSNDRKSLMYGEDSTSSQLHQLVNRPLDLAGCVAIDLLPGDNDPASKEWAISSFSPREQMNPKFMVEVNRLASLWPQRYTSISGDFTLNENIPVLSRHLGGKADVILFSTVWYQLSEPDRTAMLGNALELLSDNGLIIVQDFVETLRSVQPAGQNEAGPLAEESISDWDYIIPYSPESCVASLRFPSDWRDWSYRTLVLDPSRNGLEFVEALHFRDGRCSRLWLSDDYKQQLLGV